MDEIIDDLDVALAMVRYGGSFVAAIGNAFTYADSENVRRLKEAFPEYWKKYTDIAISMKVKIKNEQR